MVAATRKLCRVKLREDVVFSPSPLKVDREKGIIYGVKVLGLDSKNKRRYLPEAVRGSLSMYEGIKVFCDHPEQGKPNAPRKDRDAFGKLVNLEWTPDGTRANLHYFKSHAMAATVCEDVERGLGVFGLSHNAVGEGETKDGIFVVSKIIEVRSVDLVSEAATVENLWESQGMKKPKKLTEAEVIEGMRRLREADEYGVMDDSDPAASPDEESYETHLGRMISAIIKDDSLDAAAKKKKVLSSLKLMDDGEVEEKDDSAEKSGEGEKEKAKEKDKETEGLERQIRVLTAKDKARELCEAVNLVPDPVFLKSLVRCESDAEMKQLIDREVKQHKSSGSRPRSQAPSMAITEGADANAARGNFPKFKTTEELANWIRN